MIEPVMVIPRQGSELKAVEEVCREASRTAEPLIGLNDLNAPRLPQIMPLMVRLSNH